MAAFKPNFITLNGDTLHVIGDSIKIEGISGLEKSEVLGAGGYDETISKRVARKINASIVLKDGQDINTIKVCDAQIVVGMASDCGDGQATRIRCNPCDTISVGEIGNEGTLEITWLVKAPVEWI